MHTIISTLWISKSGIRSWKILVLTVAYQVIPIKFRENSKICRIIQSVLEFPFESTYKFVLCIEDFKFQYLYYLGSNSKIWYMQCSTLCGMLFTSAHINSRFSSRIARALIRHFSTLGTENLDVDKNPKARFISFLHFISWQAWKLNSLILFYKQHMIKKTSWMFFDFIQLLFIFFA